LHRRRRPRKRRRRVPLLHDHLNSRGEATVPEDVETHLLYTDTDTQRGKHRDALGPELARKMGFLCLLVLNRQIHYIFFP
jgi:hypothetical protein